MKILQFSLPGQPAGPGPGRRPKTGDFEAALASFKPAGAVEGPGGRVWLENRRARQLPPAGEMREAGQLLDRLAQTIRGAPPEVLGRVHNLEGLLCLYRRPQGPNL